MPNETKLLWYNYSERKPEKTKDYLVTCSDGIVRLKMFMHIVEKFQIADELVIYWAEITTPVLGDVSGVEKCGTCGQKKESVRERPNSFVREIHCEPDAVHTVCDECDEENRLAI